MEMFDKAQDNTVRRGSKRASYCKEDVYKVLDAAVVCYVAFSFRGKPMVQPISYGRKDDTIYIHGSHLNRMTRAIVEAGEVCLNVTLLDGLLLTKSAFHHSVNYRSVVIFGTTRELETEHEKLEGLETIINHFVPNRWPNCRVPSDNELKGTRVVAIQITTASAKLKNTESEDNMEDHALPYWAGVIPVKTCYDKPVSASYSTSVSIPDHVMNCAEKRNQD